MTKNPNFLMIEFFGTYGKIVHLLINLDCQIFILKEVLVMNKLV